MIEYWGEAALHTASYARQRMNTGEKKPFFE